MNELKYRHEYKHRINLADYYSICQRVRAVATLDCNAGPASNYHVRSLYFDNDADKALREKLYGLPNREKYRLRLYNGNTALIRFEKKSKMNGLCNKRSAKLTREQAELLLAGDVSWIPATGDALLLEFYSKYTYERLRPKTIVEYSREAYLFPYGNVRITFDSDIRTGLYGTGFLEPELPLLQVCAPGTVILELKYDNFLPDIMRDLVQTNARRTEAFSKYAACRIYG